MSRLHCYLLYGDLTLCEALELYRACPRSVQQEFSGFSVRISEERLASIPIPDHETWLAIVHVMEFMYFRQILGRKDNPDVHGIQVKLIRYLTGLSYFDLADKLKEHFNFPWISARYYVANGSLEARRRWQLEAGNLNNFCLQDWWLEAPLTSTELLDQYNVWHFWMNSAKPLQNPIQFLYDACRYETLFAVEWFMRKSFEVLADGITWADIMNHQIDCFQGIFAAIFSNTTHWKTADNTKVLAFLKHLLEAPSPISSAKQELFIKNDFIRAALRETKELMDRKAKASHYWQG